MNESTKQRRNEKKNTSKTLKTIPTTQLAEIDKFKTDKNKVLKISSWPNTRMDFVLDFVPNSHIKSFGLSHKQERLSR